jgi:hypothetical protein
VTRRQELKELDKRIAAAEQRLVEVSIEVRKAEMARDLALHAAQQIEGAKAGLLHDLDVLGREVWTLELRKREAA